LVLSSCDTLYSNHCAIKRIFGITSAARDCSRIHVSWVPSLRMKAIFFNDSVKLARVVKFSNLEFKKNSLLLCTLKVGFLINNIGFLTLHRHIFDRICST